MYGTLTRKIRDVYNGRRRNHRPAKLRKIQDDIDDEVTISRMSSAVSEQSDDEEEDILIHDSVSASGSQDLPNIPSTAVPETCGQPSASTEADGKAPREIIEDQPTDAFPPLSEALEAEKFSQPETMAETVDEEAMRHAEYIIFNGEDETDYTRGLPRLVFAHDGVERCAGLLMTLDLSRKIQAAVRSQRRYAASAIKARRSDDADYDFEDKLRTRISDHEDRVFMLENSGDSASEEFTALQDELTKLHLLMENTKARRQVTSAELLNEASNWRETQADVNAYLEEAFVHAMLLEPAVDEVESPIEKLTVEGEFEQICRQIQESQGLEATAIEPLHDCAPTFEPEPLSPEEEAAKAIQGEFWSAWHDLESAQADFDRREVDCARERQENIDADARGEQPRDASPEAFDQRWLIRVQELTANLMRAEEALAVAKAKAQEAGVEVCSYDQASGFVDDVQDGYRVSQEREIAAAAPVPKITNWLSRVPSALVSPSFPAPSEESAADDWEADEVGLSDSASVVAEGAERRRIDKWRKVCGL